MPKLTHGDKIRQQILDYLESKTQFIAPLSYEQIAQELGFASKNTVEYHLKLLEQEGKLELLGSRTIKVTK